MSEHKDQNNNIQPFNINRSQEDRPLQRYNTPCLPSAPTPCLHSPHPRPLHLAWFFQMDWAGYSASRLVNKGVSEVTMQKQKSMEALDKLRTYATDSRRSVKLHPV